MSFKDGFRSFMLHGFCVEIKHRENQRMLSTDMQHFLDLDPKNSKEKRETLAFIQGVALLQDNDHEAMGISAPQKHRIGEKMRWVLPFAMEKMLICKRCFLCH